MRRRRTLLGLLVTYALSALLSPAPSAAQVPYYIFDSGTEVGSLSFDFPDGQTFDKSKLLDQMVLGGPGFLAGLRRKLSFLPLVPAPSPHPFAPLTLQRDVARLRRFYQNSGFLGTDVRYRVDYHPKDDRVAVDMIVSEGRPILLRSVRVLTDQGANPAEALPGPLGNQWKKFEQSHPMHLGERYTDAARSLLVGDVLSWWRDRGFPFIRAKSDVQVDSAAAAADLAVHLDPGPRARVGSIDVEGNESVSSNLIRRALPFHKGDWFSADALAAGQRRIFALDLFRLVLVRAPEDQPRDSTVQVQVRVEESPPRLLTGELGYASAGAGLTGHAKLADRNFMGGARTLETDARFQTGLFSWTDTPDRQLGLSFSYRRPFTFHPRITLTVAPYVRYRDNVVDRSREFGLTTSLIYELGRSSFLTLQHQYSSRRVYEYRVGSANSADLQNLFRLAGAGALDSLHTHVERSTVSLSATLGRFDPTQPRRAVQAHPTVEVTTPSGLNTVEYVLVDAPVLAYLPLGHRFALAGRLRFGRVFPYGPVTGIGGQSHLLREAQLRDVLLTAGGTGSVRGWAPGLVGPKFPNLLFSGLGGDSVRVATDGYIPSGGLARASGSLELRMPFPGLGSTWGTHLFLDWGRVWNPGNAFDGPDPYHQQRWFFGTGGGIDITSPVGPIRVSLGYKLNPSPLDLRDARQVYDAISNGRPLSTVPTPWYRRFHLHIALGSAF